MTQMLMGASGGPVSNWTGSISRIVATPSSAAGGIDIGVDGTVTGGFLTGVSAWHQPTGGTPGNSYWVKFTTVGTAWDAGLTAGTVYALTSIRSVGWSTTFGSKSGTLTVSIYSDAAGTQLVGTGTVTYLVESN